MTILKAVILGIVQGAAEFLPISSSGHLVIVSSLLGSEGDLFFDVLLHLGTFLAVIIAFWKDILRLLVELFLVIGDLLRGRLFKAEKTPYRNFLYMMILSLLPLFLVLPFRDKIEALFSSPVFVGGALLVTGCILLFSDRVSEGEKRMRTTGVRDALIVGFTQLFAVIPGVSRSGSTITAGLATGFKRDYAVKYSFILSLPATLAAGLLELFDTVKAGGLPENMTPYLIGMAAAAVAGWFSIAAVRAIVKNAYFKYFAYYCFVVGTATIIYFGLIA
jgi:undecaprenyl-diphosphatase